MSKVIPLRPKHQPVIESRKAILIALSLLRADVDNKESIDLILSSVADTLYDYVETTEGR